MILPILFLVSQIAAIILLLAILESSRQRSRHEKILRNLGLANNHEDSERTNETAKAQLIVE